MKESRADTNLEILVIIRFTFLIIFLSKKQELRYRYTEL
jgi:hypothetical protein